MDRLAGGREGRCTPWVHVVNPLVDLRGEISEWGCIDATERVRRVVGVVDARRQPRHLPYWSRRFCIKEPHPTGQGWMASGPHRSSLR